MTQPFVHPWVQTETHHPTSAPWPPDFTPACRCATGAQPPLAQKLRCQSQNIPFPLNPGWRRDGGPNTPSQRPSSSKGAGQPHQPRARAPACSGTWKVAAQPGMAESGTTEQTPFSCSQGTFSQKTKDCGGSDTICLPLIYLSQRRTAKKPTRSPRPPSLPTKRGLSHCPPATPKPLLNT